MQDLTAQAAIRESNIKGFACRTSFWKPHTSDYGAAGFFNAPYFWKLHKSDCVAAGAFSFQTKCPRRGLLLMHEKEGIKGNYTPTVAEDGETEFF